MNTDYPQIRLKPRRDISILNRHPWIFSGAIVPSTQKPVNGSLVHVLNSDGAVVATGTYSGRSMITVRVFEFGPATIDSGWLHQRIMQAVEKRRLLGFGGNPQSTGYRVVFGESDGLPGLVADLYDDVLVIQIATAGMELLRDMVVECLVDIIKPRAIFERSDLPNRGEEGLEIRIGSCYGETSDMVEFLENGRRCVAEIRDGQKTGFFLDQRDLRQEIFQLAAGRRGLDLFSYSGAAGMAAMAGGAESMRFVDSSATALGLCQKHAELNGIDPARVSYDEADIFQWLSARSEPEYDLVMIDPPALIKSQKHIETGRKGYHFLNRAALRLVRTDGIFVTSSCSAFFPESDFTVTLRRAAEQAGVSLSLLKTVRQSPDHPLSLYFPEAAYLKSFICRVGR